MVNGPYESASSGRVLVALTVAIGSPLAPIGSIRDDASSNGLL